MLTLLDHLHLRMKVIMRLMYSLILLIASLTFALVGCVNGVTPGVATFSGPPIPLPYADRPIHSVDYYNAKYKVNLASMNHNINEEIQREYDAVALVNKIVKVRVGSQQITAKPRLNYINKSKKIGKNEYIIECTNFPPIQAQEKTELCWASCVQYLAYVGYNVKLSQQAIAAETNKNNGRGINSPGTIMDMMTSLGLSGLWLTSNGSFQIVDTLSENLPLMIGKKPEREGESGHAVVVVGAKYSFVNSTFPSLPPARGIAFSEFAVLDPSDGKLHMVPAAELEDKIDFVLSFYVERH